MWPGAKEVSECLSKLLKCRRQRAWPIALAFGITLLFAGLVTSDSVSVLGALVAIASAVGWFRDVLPHEAHELVPVAPK